MFSIKLFKCLTKLTYRSVNCNNYCLNNLLKSRQLIDRLLLIRRSVNSSSVCIDINGSNSERNEEKVREKERIDSVVKAIVENKKSLDLDLNDKQMIDLFANKRIDALSERTDYELLDEISPTIGQSFNLSAFADKSQTIQMLIKLGVDLSKIEQKNDKTAQFLLQLDFESDVKPYIRFLVDNGVQASDLGYFLTRNPIIFRQHLDDLKVRINYLSSKRFTSSMIASILTKAPKFVNHSTKFIDYKLAFIQKEFQLSADELRQTVTAYPRNALLHDMSFRELSFMFKEEFGFNSIEIKAMLMKCPVIFRRLVVTEKNHRLGVKIFDYIHNDMQIPHELICKSPQILNRRLPLIQCRHLYLKELGRDQYDPKQPLYVPLSAFYEPKDNEFCDKYAKTNVLDFNRFCKTL